ncbi:MAG TPA: hypothetical protein VM490_10580 [Armatimonadaceae bacterium]|nr:hypothetical protein [Armatimonadaceae bacterium]
MAHGVRRLIPVLILLLASTAAMLLGFSLGKGRVGGAAARRNEVEVVALNVGHGESAWVRTPGGRFVVIGGGPPGQGAVVAQSLRAAGAERIDLLILPYPYPEAIGGAEELLETFPVSMAMEPGGERVNEWQENCRRFLRQNRVPVRLARAGQEFVLDGVRIAVLAPTATFTQAEPVSANNSVVVAVRWGETRFLFAGGMERGGEFALLARTPDLSADWLRVAHFGTRQASSSEFLRLVSPRFAVISVGENPDGFPHSETLERVRATGAELLRTDEAQGDLRFVSDGNSVRRVTAPVP